MDQPLLVDHSDHIGAIGAPSLTFMNFSDEEFFLRDLLGTSHSHSQEGGANKVEDTARALLLQMALCHTVHSCVNEQTTEDADELQP